MSGLTNNHTKDLIHAQCMERIAALEAVVQRTAQIGRDYDESGRWIDNATLRSLSDDARRLVDGQGDVSAWAVTRR